ncbi:MAG: hypothetical protein DHS20C18_41330 [Saprospiraceae bacterium]|nr:MAG: hypothetical protein DHS20C18_41330 [Saprospiraceae bacterium]
MINHKTIIQLATWTLIMVCSSVAYSQRVENPDGSVSYTIFKTLMFNNYGLLSYEELTGSNGKLNPNISDINGINALTVHWQQSTQHQEITKALIANKIRGKVSVNVYYERYYHEREKKPNNEDYAKLFKFSFPGYRNISDATTHDQRIYADEVIENLRYTDPKYNTIKEWRPGKVPGIPSPEEMMVWARMKQEGSLKQQESRPIADYRWGIPVRIEITFQYNSDVEHINSIQVPYMTNPLWNTHFTEFQHIKYFGLKPISMSGFLTRQKLLDYHKQNPKAKETNEINRFDALGFGTKPSTSNPIPKRRFFTNIEVEGTKPTPKVHALSNDDGLSKYTYGEILVPLVNFDQSQFSNAEKEKLTEAFFTIKLYHDENNPHSRALRFLSPYPLAKFSSIFKNSSLIDDTGLKPVRLSNDNFTLNVVSYGAQNYPVILNASDGTKFNLYEIKLKKNIKEMTLKIGVDKEAGPFPVAANFKVGPLPNKANKPFITGPTPEKPHLIGSHRGFFMEPDIPENSPWAWERAIYLAEQKRNEEWTDKSKPKPPSYLDFIEVDIGATAKTKDGKGVILASHDDYPCREVQLEVLPPPQSSTNPFIKQSNLKFKEFYFDQDTEHPLNSNKTFKALDKSNLKDFFGTPVKHTMMLTHKEVIEYFKCRQTHGAVYCLMGKNWLPPIHRDSKTTEDEYKNTVLRRLKTIGMSDKTWVVDNIEPYQGMLVLDKADKKADELITVFKTALELNMEDYIVFSGGAEPSAYYEVERVKDKTTLEQQLKSHILRQMFYNAIIYVDKTLDVQRWERNVEEFLKRRNTGDFRSKWQIVGFQPQVPMPLHILHQNNQLGNQNTTELEARLKSYQRIIKTATDANCWIEIYGGSPKTPQAMGLPISHDNCPFSSIAQNENCSNYDWRSMPEFAWSAGNNYWVTDNPNMVYAFLKNMPTREEAVVLNPNIKTLDDLQQRMYIWESIPIGETEIYLDDSRINKGVPYALYEFSQFNATQTFQNLGTNNEEIKPKYPNGGFSDVDELYLTSSTYLNYKTTKSGHPCLNLDDKTRLKTNMFFGLDQSQRNSMVYKAFEYKHFTLSMWVYYEGAHDNFDIFTATDNQDHVIFALKSVKKKLVWTRNTWVVDRSPSFKGDQYNYDLVINKGCTFEEPGWYFIYISMGNNACRIAMGKPSPMKYLSNTYGYNFDENSGPGPYKWADEKNMAVAYFFMGTALQSFHAIDKSYIGSKDNQTHNPRSIADLRVYPNCFGVDAPYLLFNATKKDFGY